MESTNNVVIDEHTRIHRPYLTKINVIDAQTCGMMDHQTFNISLHLRAKQSMNNVQA